MNNVLLSGCAAALALAATLVQAGGPFHYGANYGYSGCSTCNSGCWASPGCCDHPLSKNDHIWDNYCQEKWCKTRDSAYLRPYWHGAPVSAGYGYGSAPVYGGSNYSEGVPAHGQVSYSNTSLPMAQPTPAAPSPSVLPPSPMATPDVQPPMPPSPPASDADKPLELKLLPLSRQRAPQT